MIYDISPPVSENLAVWPGDLDFKRIIQQDIRSGDALTLSGLQTTVHIGAHADAPSHFSATGQSIDECPLETYLGKCQVIMCSSSPGQPVKPDDLNSRILAPRILLKTGSFPNPDNWNTDFCYLSSELIDLCSKQQVKLIGIDTPSVDSFESEQFNAHHALIQAKIAILEGIILDKVPEGIYELIALPLKLAGFDASPVRAILRTLDKSP